jgi:hypothetical protein
LGPFPFAGREKGLGRTQVTFDITGFVAEAGGIDAVVNLPELAAVLGRFVVGTLAAETRKEIATAIAARQPDTHGP